MSSYIPDDKIDEVRERSNIVDVVSQYVSLKKSGRNYIGLCPFHSEKTPSFTVSEEKEIFHCFGCGAGGNVFGFLMRAEGMSFPEAVRDLAEKAGVEIPESGSGRLPEENTEKEELIRLHEDAANLYSRLLMRSRECDFVRDYLRERGIDSEVAKMWRLGFGGKEWSAFAKTLKDERDIATADKAGLIIKKRRGGYYDRFRNRLIFPIADLKGRTVAFGGRVIEGEGPKYVNSPESILYTKGNILYGLNLAKTRISAEGAAIVVEGYMDLLALYRSGIENVVATLGTAMTLVQASLLKRFCSRVVLLFDSDRAGLKAAARGIETCMDAGLDPFVLLLPEGSDPDSFVADKGGRALKNLMQSAIPGIEFVLSEKLKEQPVSSPSEKAGMIEALLPLIRKIDSRIEKSLTVQRVAEILDVDADLVNDAVSEKKGGRRSKSAGDRALYNKKGAKEVAEETILYLIVSDGEILDAALKEGVAELFNLSRLRPVVEKIEELHSLGKAVTPAVLIDALEEETLRERVSSIFVRGETLKSYSPQDVFKDCRNVLRKYSVIEEEKRINQKIKHAQEKGELDKLDAFLKEKQRILLLKKEIY